MLMLLLPHPTNPHYFSCWRSKLTAQFLDGGKEEVLSSVSGDISSTSALSQHWKFPLIERELKLFAASSPELFSRKSRQHQWPFITEKQS